MSYKSDEYRAQLVQAIDVYQDEHLLSDRKISLQAGLSPTMVSKIRKGTTVPKLATLRKLKLIGIEVPKPNREIIESLQKSQQPQQVRESSSGENSDSNS